MDQVLKVVGRYAESAQAFSAQNPVVTGAATLAALGAAHLLLSGPAKLKINPKECIIVITGCDSGFGLASSKRLQGLGYRVVAACLLQEGADRLLGEVELALKCDITKEEDIQMLVQKTTELASSTQSRVWALVNNAGVANAGGLDWCASSTVRKVMEVNFFGLFEVTRAFLPQLKQTKNSRIINISSGAGLSGFYNMGMYCGRSPHLTSPH